MEYRAPKEQELRIEEYLCAKATLKKIPISATFELLPICNMDCQMCYVRLEKSQVERAGGLRSAGEWLALAKEAKEAGLLFLTLTGGEPLLYPEFQRLYQGLLELGIVVTINTNGTLIDEGWADFFSEHIPRRINITLYGAAKETYGRLCGNSDGFTKAVSAVRLLREKGVAVKLNASIISENQHEIPELYKIARSLQVPMKADTYMYPVSRKPEKNFMQESRLSPQNAARCFMMTQKEELSREAYEAYVSALKEHIAKQVENAGESPEKEILQEERIQEKEMGMECRAAASSFYVTWDGKMIPCVFLDWIRMEVFREGFSESWDYLVSERKKIKITNGCASCGSRIHCPVCTAAIYAETGGLFEKPEYLCAIAGAIQEQINAIKSFCE